MDPEAFLDLANQVAKLKMYPYFDIAHAVVCCLALKEDMGSGKIGILFMHWDRFIHTGDKKPTFYPKITLILIFQFCE